MNEVGVGEPLLRLRSLSLAARLLATGLLLGAAGGFIAAQVNLRATHELADGRPGLDMEDIRRVFHGRPGWSYLGSKIDGGSMERHIPVASEKATVLRWIDDGALRENFAPVRDIISRRCLSCHAPGKQKESTPFTQDAMAGADWDLIRVHCRPDDGMSVAALAKSTHAHLFGMSVLLFALGFVYLGTDASSRNKCVAVALPFAAMFLDIGCWWLARLDPIFCWGVLAGGILLAATTANLLIRSLWELWTPGET